MVMFMSRKLGSHALTMILAVAFTLSVTTKNAHAYIDMGSGSMMIQILVASLFGSLFWLKMFWSRVTGPIFRLYAKMRGSTEPGE